MNTMPITIYQLSLPLFMDNAKKSAWNAGCQNSAFDNFQTVKELFILAVLGSHLGSVVLPKDICLEARGKPFLDPIKFPKVHFNVSHTKEHLVLAIAEFPIGIDIEPIKENFASVLLPRIVHPEDALKIDSSDAFYRFWSIKEAFVKYLGTGLHLPLNEVVIREISEEKAVVESQEARAEICAIDLLKGHTCFLAGERLSQVKITVVSHEMSAELLNAVCKTK